MVCERNADSPYDPAEGRILVTRERDRGKEWIRACGTTLGADNGIGVAAMMAVAEMPGVAHGPYCRERAQRSPARSRHSASHVV